MNHSSSQQGIASSITRTASRQTFYTIRFLVDRDRIPDAYRAYAYFRWVDDTLDSATLLREKRSAFLQRQESLLESCYQNKSFPDPSAEERMLIELIQGDHDRDSGLHAYLDYMMHVMAFDAGRRGRLISQAELREYTRWLATAVTEAMHYFIGHGSYSPHEDNRYLAVTGAHIVHMLRDTFDDVQSGYYNIPREVLEANSLQPQDIHSNAYRAWVKTRVQMARQCFAVGRNYLARVAEPRCRLAGLAYMARFKWLLDEIERENYVLRPAYGERRSLGTGLRMCLSMFNALTNGRGGEPVPQAAISRSLRKL